MWLPEKKRILKTRVGVWSCTGDQHFALRNYLWNLRVCKAATGTLDRLSQVNLERVDKGRWYTSCQNLRGAYKSLGEWHNEDYLRFCNWGGCKRMFSPININRFVNPPPDEGTDDIPSELVFNTFCFQFPDRPRWRLKDSWDGAIYVAWDAWDTSGTPRPPTWPASLAETQRNLVIAVSGESLSKKTLQPIQAQTDEALTHAGIPLDAGPLEGIDHFIRMQPAGTVGEYFERPPGQFIGSTPLPELDDELYLE